VGQFVNLEMKTVRKCWQDARPRIRGEQKNTDGMHFGQFQFLEAKDNGGGNCVLHATILSAKSRSTNAIWVLQFFLAIIGPNDQTTPAD